MFTPKRIFFIGIAVLVVGSVAYIYTSRNRDVRLFAQAPTEAHIGIPFELPVEISNQSNSILNDVTLIVTLPSGAVFSGSSETKTLEQRHIGNVGEGSLVTEKIPLVFLRGKDTEQIIKIAVSYSPQSLGARFETIKEISIPVRNSGVTLTMSGLDVISSGADLDIAVAYRNESDIDFHNLELTLEYPALFEFKEATLKPDKKTNNYWQLGDLRSGSEGKFSVKGMMVGPDGASGEFIATLKTQIANQIYTLEPERVPVTIAPSPLLLNIKVNDQSEYVASPGEDLMYTITYLNNTDVALRNVTLRVQLIGALFNTNTIETNGLARPDNGTIIWDNQILPELNLVDPKSAGAVQFKIKTLPQYPIRRFSDKNFTLKIKAEIESPTVPELVGINRTYSLQILETRVSGSLAIDAKGFFRDAASGILNSGSLPLRVGQVTQMTIHWLLRNYANDVNGVEARATLPEGVRFTGQSQSNFGAAPTYDEGSRQVVWSLPSIAANKGVIDQPLEAVFQIEITPSSPVIGSYMPIMSETTVKAADTFSGKEITARDEALTSALPDDPTMRSRDGVVQP